MTGGSQRIEWYRYRAPAFGKARVWTMLFSAGADAVIQKLSQRLQSQIFLTPVDGLPQKFVGKNGVSGLVIPTA